MGYSHQKSSNTRPCQYDVIVWCDKEALRSGSGIDRRRAGEREAGGSRVHRRTQQQQHQAGTHGRRAWRVVRSNQPRQTCHGEALQRTPFTRDKMEEKQGEEIGGALLVLRLFDWQAGKRGSQKAGIGLRGIDRLGGVGQPAARRASCGSLLTATRRWRPAIQPAVGAENRT